MADPSSVMSTESAIGVLFTNMKRVYKFGEQSDITVIIDSEEFKLHKPVICHESPKLKALCEGKDKVEIEPLKNLDYVQRSYETMFQFMYGHQYPDATGIFDYPMGFHHDVYRLARYYEISGLIDLAMERFKDRVEFSFDAYYFTRILRKGGYRRDENLHKFLIQTCHDEIEPLLDHEHFLDLWKKDRQLGIDLAQSYVNSLYKFCCPQCKVVWTLDISVLGTPSFCPYCGHHEEDWDDHWPEF